MLKLALSIPILLMLTAWSAACLLLDGPQSRPIAGLLSTGFVIGALLVTVLARPVWRMWLTFAVLFFTLQIWWLGIDASNDREWLPDVAQLPIASFEGDLLTLENVHNFDYRSEDDFDPSAYTARRSEQSLQLEDPRERLYRRTRIRPGHDRHQPPLRGAETDQRDHREGAGGGRQSEFLETHPRGAPR